MRTKKANEIFTLDQLGYKLADNQQQLTPLQRRFLLLMNKKQQQDTPDLSNLASQSNNVNNQSVKDQSVKSNLKQQVKERRESSGSKS